MDEAVAQAVESNKVDPVHQFGIHDIFGLGNFGRIHLGFTNSGLFMVVVVLLVIAFMLLASSRRAVIPGRLQSLGEIAYEFIANMLREAAGPEAMKFFPFVFSLFMFVLVGNLLGLIPYFYTITSQIIVTFGLALSVILTVIIYGFYKNGAKFLGLFVPAGVPGYLIPIVLPIEVISFLSRPVSLSVRLFANMLAGHITLKVFAGFVVTLSAAGALGTAGAVLPFLMTVALTALEVLVAFLQAYVFAILTCMYLNDALHPSH